MSAVRQKLEWFKGFRKCPLGKLGPSDVASSIQSMSESVTIRNHCNSESPVITYRGRVKNGTILLDEPVVIPDGTAVEVVVTPEETVSPDQAAELLNVSKAYVLKLIAEDQVAVQQSGTQLRLRREDVLQLRKRLDERTDAALTALTRFGQEHGLGY